MAWSYHFVSFVQKIIFSPTKKQTIQNISKEKRKYFQLKRKQMKHHIPITPRNEKPSIEWPHVEIPGKTAYCFLIILLLLYKF